MTNPLPDRPTAPTSGKRLSRSAHEREIDFDALLDDLMERHKATLDLLAEQ